MRICIITQALRTNYGGLLQAFALQKVLRDMGHNVVTDKHGAFKGGGSFIFRLVMFIFHLYKRYIRDNKQCNPFRYLFTSFDRERIIYNQISVNTERFINRNISTTLFFDGDNMRKPKKETLDSFDAIVSGSDQIWRVAFSYTPAYFLDFASDKSIKKIVYAASFGANNLNEYTPKILRKCKDAAKYLNAVSVREDSAVDICKNNFNIKAEHVLDPTMLLTSRDYINLIEDEDKEYIDNILMCYVLDKSETKNEIINAISNKLGLDILKVMPKKGVLESFNSISEVIYPSVSKWLAGFRDAKFVITDSFHGTVFSIIFNKPFISIVNSNRGSARFSSILKIFGLENRLISNIDELSDDLLYNIDYENINDVLSVWRNKSKCFLTKNL